MAVRPPSLPSLEVLCIIKQHFPFISVKEESIKELVSYDDRNYYFCGELPTQLIPQYPSNQKVHITSTNEFVLKILNRRDSADRNTTEYLTEMKKYLYSNGYNVPFPIPSNHNGSEIVTLMESDLLHKTQSCNEPDKVPNGSATSNHQCLARVLTYIPGVVLHDAPHHQPQLMFRVGEYLGNLHNKLKVYYNFVR